MIKLFSSDDRVLIYHLQNMLAAEGLESVIRNDMMFTLAGEVPATEVWPELWLMTGFDQHRAEQIVQQSIAAVEQNENDWVCENCGEIHGVQFSECWHCGAGRKR